MQASSGLFALQPGVAILLGLLLLLGPRRRRLTAVGASALGVACGTAPFADLATTCAAVLGATGALTVGLGALAASGRTLDLARPRDLGRFVTYGIAGASLGGTLGWGLGRLYGAELPDGGTLLQHGLAIALGATLIAPALLLSRHRLTRPTFRGIACQALLLGTTLLVCLQQTLPLSYMVLPPLLLATARGGLPGAVLGLFLVALVTGGLGLAGIGRFAHLAPALEARILVLQVFLLVLAATAFPLAAMLATRVRLEAVLRRSRRRSRSRQALLTGVLEAMEQGFAAFGADGRLLAANRRFPKMIDVPSALTVPGTPLTVLIAHQAACGRFGPGDPMAIAATRSAALGAAGAHTFTREIDGQIIEVHHRPLPEGGFVQTLTDATERLRQTARLAESEANFRLLAENSGDVIIRTGLDGVRRYVSPSVRRVLSWSPEELIGRPMRDFVHPEDRAWVDSINAALRAGEAEETTVTYRFRRPDGSHAWVECRVRVRRDAATGAPVELVVALRDATDRKAAEAELLAAFEHMENAALSDGLTGLANRRRFDEAFAREWRRALRERDGLSLLLIDADRFKLFNDQYGHGAGDRCLQSIAAVLADSSRRAGDLAARYGGEEFALLLPGTDAIGARDIAERIRAGVQTAAIPHAGNPPSRVVTVSVGVVSLPAGLAHAPDGAALLAEADRALYAAKAGGRNRVMSAPSGFAAAA